MSRVSSRCVIVPSGIEDVYRLASSLRPEDRAEITGLALEPRAIVRASFRGAIMRRTAFVDGEIAAMWGLGGPMLGDEGTPWLLTTAAVERVPVIFIKVARAQVAEMLTHRAYLSNYVAASYRGACRLLETLGFTLEAPQPLGINAVPFRRFWMKR